MNDKEQIEELNGMIKQLEKIGSPVPKGWISALENLKQQLKNGESKTEKRELSKEEKRIAELKFLIERFAEAGGPVDIRWIVELGDLERAMGKEPDILETDDIYTIRKKFVKFKEEHEMYDCITVSCRGFTGELKILTKTEAGKGYHLSIRDTENTVTHVLENVKPNEIKLVSGRVTMG